MKLLAPSQRRRGEPIGPLIDVVFLLLIFFMLAGVLRPPEPVKVEPPHSEGANPAGEGTVRILLGTDDQLAFQSQEIDRQTLQQAVAQQLSTTPDLLVELKADATVEALEVIAVMDILREAGVKDVLLLTAAQKP